jgi:ATP-binding protein involved in chromosome partitioning
MVREVEVQGGAVSVAVALTVAACPLRDQLRADVERHLKAVPGVELVDVSTGVMDPSERSALMARARLKAQDRAVPTDIPATARVLAVASGKGGVGKSSVSVNLAVSLARRGLVVGLLDADVWGHSVPRLLAMEGAIQAHSGKMIPFERVVGSGLLKVISMGFLSGEDEAIMWRGLMLNRAVQHFLEDVRWGALDYLVIDLPPGTGDVQMGLARMLPRTELLVVTTPNQAAQKVAGRAADMARRGHIRVAGVIENMSASPAITVRPTRSSDPVVASALPTRSAYHSSGRCRSMREWLPAVMPARLSHWTRQARSPRSSLPSRSAL